MNKNFMQMLAAQWAKGKFVCVGLDPDWDKIPAHLKKGEKDEEAKVIFLFFKEIIDATKDIVCAYKPNSAFFEAFGSYGVNALRGVIEYIKINAPEVPVILDYKRGDIESTNNGYVKFAFDYCGADAVTVQPYLGRIAMKPFLDQKDKGIIVLCKTSNKGSNEFQDLPVVVDFSIKETKSVHEFVAENVADHWNTNGNCMVVVGATYPEELKKVRWIVGTMPMLIPGIGAQGGDLEKTLEASLTTTGKGIIINSSRGIIYASNGEDFGRRALAETIRLHNAITVYREEHFGIRV